MKFKKLILALLMFCFATTLGGCGCSKEDGKENGEETSTKSESKTKLGSFVTTGVVKDQLEKPGKGEEIVSMTVKNFGTVKFRLFPEVAPNAVKNFKQFIKDGRYNGSTFHRVIKGFMIQAGREADEKGEKVQSQVELNPTVHHFNGALCLARSYDKAKGQCCQFYIVNSDEGKKVDFNAIKEKTNSTYKADGLDIKIDFDEATQKIYKEKGGAPSLDGLYTVFGQVIEGMEVVNKISDVPKKSKEEAKKSGEDNQEENSVPKDPVVIEKMEVTKL